MYADLVCKGGGIKGIALVGAICCLEEYGYKFKNLAGTSVGAIITSLLAVGYTPKEIKEIMFNLDYKSFEDKNLLQSLPYIGQFASLVISKGIYSGNYIENFLREKFKEKGKTSFRDISENNNSKLKIIATDVTNHKLMILPDDLEKYNINPLDFDIASAVRMSISIPFFYNPVILNKRKNPTYIVDGGLLSNFPIWLFDVENIPKWPTFGLNLYDDISQSCSNKNNINLLNFLIDVIQISLSTSEEVYFKDSDISRIINIPTLGINSIDFNISQKQMMDLYNSGYNATKIFLRDWDFSKYVRKYRFTPNN